MIRNVALTDAKAIVDIYNEYVLNTTITFDVDALGEDEMRARILEISSRFVFLVYEENGEILGYCYVHPWKEKAAYGLTLETTVYLSPAAKGRGIGQRLMNALIDECRKQGFHALIACITGGNEASCRLFEKLGFKQVSSFEKVGRKFDCWLDVVDYELLL